MIVWTYTSTPFQNFEVAMQVKNSYTGSWLGSSVDWSVVLKCQGFKFDPQLGHMQAATNEWIKKWNNKIDLSLSPPSFPQVNKLKQKSSFTVNPSLHSLKIPKFAHAQVPSLALCICIQHVFSILWSSLSLILVKWNEIIQKSKWYKPIHFIH